LVLVVTIAAIIGDRTLAYLFGGVACVMHVFVMMIDIGLEHSRIDRAKAIGAIISDTPDEKIIQLVIDNTGDVDDN
jgi:hypothetical protein